MLPHEIPGLPNAIPQTRYSWLLCHSFSLGLLEQEDQFNRKITSCKNLFKVVKASKKQTGKLFTLGYTYLNYDRIFSPISFPLNCKFVNLIQVL